MDGLTLDSESLGYEAYQRAGRKFGFVVNERLHMDLAGRTEEGVIEELYELYGRDKDIPRWRRYVLKQKEVILGERGGHPGTMPGLFELLDYLDSINMPRAIASSTDRAHVEALLASEYVLDRFTTLMCGDEVRKSKPDPEIFLKAAAKLGIEAQDCLVLEDSRAGIEAARAGGFQSAFVFDDVSRKGEVPEGSPILLDLPDPRSVADIADYSFASLLDVIDLIENSRAEKRFEQ